MNLVKFEIKEAQIRMGAVALVCIVGFILPGHKERKLLKSKQPGDQRL